MIPDWKRIRNVRQDITDWVIHWTRRKNSPLQMLKRILQCGYLEPSFAPKPRRTMGGYEEKTIQGRHKAVCFTDQPLWAFIQSWEELSSRYFPYAIAFEKRCLFTYGGRPVIYGDKDLLNRLHDEDKYLWVRYDPIPDPNYGNYPIDWTHEREWRARVRIESFDYLDWGSPPIEGVPLVLPTTSVDGKLVMSYPKILVWYKEDATELREWLATLPDYEGTNDFIKQFYAHLSDLEIIPLEVVSEKLKGGDDKWARLETLCLDDIPQ